MKKIKNILLLFLLFLASFSKAGCDLFKTEPIVDKPNGETIPNTYTVTWKNYGGETLRFDSNVKKNANPTYEGVIPTKPSNEVYQYVLTEWSPSLAPVTENMVYIAQFESIKWEYKIIWKNSDGTVLDTSVVEYGMIPVYNGIVPVKPSNDYYQYIF